MYWIVFIATALAATIITWCVRRLALRWRVIDDSRQAPDRKRQLQPVPLLGGLAIYIAFCATVLWLLPELTQGYLLAKHLYGVMIAGAVLMIGGTLDDTLNLSPRIQIIFPIFAAVIMVAAGIGVEYISNPFGGTINLAVWNWNIVEWGGVPYNVTLFTDVFTIVWLLGTMYTTKLLDGLDGLVPGITMIGGLVIFVLSLSSEVGQPETATLALTLAAAAGGFLLWNFSPAKIYLGEGGSLFTGFMLGVLAILSGGKIATALLILGLPIIDIVWVLLRRKWIDKRPLFSGDASHLHYQLRLFGMSDRSIVLLYYSITLLFGLSTLWFSGITKLVVLLSLVVISVALLGIVFWKTKQQQ